MIKAIKMSAFSALAYLFLPEDSRENHYSSNEESAALNIIKTVFWLGVAVLVTISLSRLG